MPEWERVNLHQVLIRRRDSVDIQDETMYTRFTIKMNFRGISVRDITQGFNIGTKRQFFVKNGQFLISKIDSLNGAFGIIPEDCNGAIITGNFWAYDINTSLVDKQYFNYFLNSPDFVNFCRSASEGTTNRLYLQEEEFLAQEIPLPPLPEQQRIVARVEGLLEKVEEARRLRAEIVTQLNAYSRSVQSASEIQTTPIGDLVKLRPPNVMVAPDETYHFAGVYSFGRGVFVGQKKQGQDFAYPRLTRLQAGNFIYPKLMAWEGAFGLVPTECDGLVVSTEYPVFEIDSQKSWNRISRTQQYGLASQVKALAPTLGGGD